METIQQYINRLDECIEYAKHSPDYNKDIVTFLNDLKYIKTPKSIHSCDIPGCVSCGNPSDDD